jgi:ketosteroid isomerase-like protein
MVRFGTTGDLQGARAATFQALSTGSIPVARLAMSQENVELAHLAYDAFNRRDLDSLLALMDADAHLVPQLAAMEGEYHGHEGIRRWWQNLLDAWPDYEAEVVDVRDLGTATLANVWFAVFPTEAGALEAAGSQSAAAKRIEP